MNFVSQIIFVMLCITYSYGEFRCNPNLVRRKCERILANNTRLYTRNGGRVRYNNNYSNWFIQCEARVCQQCYSDNDITLHYSNRCDQCIESTVSNDASLCYNPPGPTLPPNQNVCDRALVKFVCKLCTCNGEAPFYCKNSVTKIAFCQCGTSGEAICQRTGVNTEWLQGTGIVHYSPDFNYQTYNAELTDVMTNPVYNMEE